MFFGVAKTGFVTMMMYKQNTKQKNTGGGNLSKKNNPRQKGGGGNNSTANVSLTNALILDNTNSGKQVDANKNEPDTETSSRILTTTNNNSNITVWFTLNSIGDKFDNSVEQDIIQPNSVVNDKTLAVVHLTKSEPIMDNMLPNDKNQIQNHTLHTNWKSISDHKEECDLSNTPASEKDYTTLNILFLKAIFLLLIQK